jgi:hypothetical protein
LNNPVRYVDPDGRDAEEFAFRLLLIGYLMSGKGYVDTHIHFNVGGRVVGKSLGSGVKGLDYLALDVTDMFNRGSKNSLDIAYQKQGLGAEAVITFNGMVPTVEELYAMGGPFEKSLFKNVEDKISTGVAMGPGVTVEQKLDKLLPALFEYLLMSTPELIVEVSEKLDKKGYRFVDGQLILVRQKK